jgi:hypothetical protein
MECIERNIRVPTKLKDKIKLAAFSKGMTMVGYLESIVPDLVVEEKE